MQVKKTDIIDWTIYKIVSPSNRIYIGKTYDLGKRTTHYRNNLCKSQTLLYRSILKYGWDAHKLEIVEKIKSTQSFVNGKEMFWIRSYMSNYHKWPEIKGLNLTDGGEGSIGRKVSDEQRKIHSAYMKANPPKRDYTKHSEETLEKMRAKRNALFASGWIHPMQGTRRTDETLKKMSEAQKGKPSPHRGKKHSIKTKENMRQAALNRKSNPTGYKISEEGRKNIQVAQLKRGKPIIQYSLDGGFIKEFAGIGVACRELDIPRSTLGNLLNRTKKPEGKFIFRYKPKLNYTPYNFQRRIFIRQDIKEKIA